MASLKQLLSRVLSLFRGNRAERELSREIEAHLALLEDAYLAKGLTAADARLAALREFGGVDRAKEQHRDTRSFRWLEDIPRDASYAVRSLRRTPAFTVAAVLTLAVGIGATTTIYSVVEAVLLRPLPFPGSDRLVMIREPELPRGTPGPDNVEFLEWRKRMTTLEDVAAQTSNPQVMIVTREGAARLSAGIVSTNYFDLHKATAALGRVLHPSDDAAPDVVVLTDATWRTYFQASPAAIGSVIEIRGSFFGGPSNLGATPGQAGTLMTIVGVLPPDFDTLGRPFDFYAPLVAPPGRTVGIGMFGRLRDGVSLAAAQEEANVVGEAVRPHRAEGAPALTMPRMQVVGVRDRLVEPIRPALTVFLAAVAVVLLIVCANVANLMLARGTARSREMAVRLAIGASRGRVVRQTLTECLVLAIAGGLAGAIVSLAGVNLVKQLATVDSQGVFRYAFGGNLLPRLLEVEVNARILLIALVSSIGAGVVFATLPAFQLTRVSQLAAMGRRGETQTRHDARVRTLLAGAQVVMATMLLISASLLVNSFFSLSRVEKGYDPHHALAFYLVLPPDYSTERKASTIGSILTALRRMPDVEQAGFAYAGILLGLEDTVGTFVPPGRSFEELQADPAKARLKSLSAGYLESMGVPLLEGRLLDGRDDRAAPLAVLINRTVANRYFPNADPVGSTMRWRLAQEFDVQIVGVIEDIRQGRVDTPAYAEVFMDYRQVRRVQEQLNASKQRLEQITFGFMSFGVRARGNPDRLIPLVRTVVKSVDANAGIDAIQSMERMVGSSMARQRFYAILLGIFAGVAALLAAIGIYGVLAYAVVQRTQEIGVRMALGAERRQVLGLILGRGLLVSTSAIAIGMLAAFAGARSLQSMLYGVEARDPRIFALVAAVFAIVALLASYLPARRATKVDPMTALRVE